MGAFDPTYYQHERYATPRDGSRALDAFYAIKPMVPRPVQLWLRRLIAPLQARRKFPAWPIEPILVQHLHDDLRARLSETPLDRVPLVHFWPDRRRWAAVLTHDVEGPRGIARLPLLLEVERRHGFVSSWNFCAEWYDVPSHVFPMLRSARCEIGLHGTKHDGRLFADRESFLAELPKIHRYMREWGAVGFRSPATHRQAAWMHELDCLYDSSYPDTDPFGPQGGGCCSIFPFSFGGVVELPITLAQDHTLWEILHQDDIDLWRTKARWVADNHGLVNVIVHPDYVDSAKRLADYEELLVFLRHELSEGWHALPREVAEWWRVRAGLLLSGDEERIMIEGDGAARASVAWARESGGRVIIDLDAA